MTDSILSVLELVREALPPSLIDAEGYARLAVIAGALPEALTTFWGFECRLGEADARADILFETRKESRGQRLLAGQIPSALDALCQHWPAWHNLRQFAGLWADPISPLYHGIRNVWLEFDTTAAVSVAQAAEVIRQPSIFFGPAAESLGRDQISRLTLDTLAAIGHNDGDAWNLQRFVTALPEGARLFQVGLMLSRKSPGLRVCVSKLAAEQIPAWLCQTGWNGNPDALAEVLQTLMPIVKTLAVGLNLTADGPAEKIGLECYMEWLEDNPQQWQPLFDVIEQGNLCLPPKRQGCSIFPESRAPLRSNA